MSEPNDFRKKDGDPEGREGKVHVVVITLYDICLFLAFAVAGCALMMSINFQWVAYIRTFAQENAPEILGYLPFSSLPLTIMWVGSFILASVRAAYMFMRNRYVSGALTVAGYAFWGYMLMYTFPFSLVMILILLFRMFVHPGQARFIRKVDGKKQEDEHPVS